jgi:peptidoglycan/xylan/chitin deacetylase (PgdA/CDA1 family)
MIYLLAGIDTEGDNQWDAAARANQTFENIYALPSLHALFAKHKVRPTYLITHPVAADPRSAETLRALRGQGGCEIGAHHHAWETPPFEPEDVERHTYALALPPDRFASQLARLTDTIEAAVGARPTSYRSGRFGFSIAHVSELERQGYLVESSIAPLFYETHKGGPEFVEAPLRPYFLSYDDPVKPGTSSLLELPVTAALHRQYPAWLQYRYARAPWPYTTKRILRKLGLARMLWLRPSYSSLDDMKQLASTLAGRHVPLLSLIFHSSEAIVGGSPYNRTARELEAFLDRLDQFLSFAVSTLGAVPATFTEFRARYLST